MVVVKSIFYSYAVVTCVTRIRDYSSSKYSTERKKDKALGFSSYFDLFYRCLLFRMSTVSKPMSNVHRYGISFRNLFIRNQFWPLLIPSITVLFLFFAPNVSSALKISPQENSDRTVAKLSSRDLQITQNNQQPFYSHE